MLALDSEATGLDLRHGARPFFISSCNRAGEQQWWEWDVDPTTRQPIIPPYDVAMVNLAITDAEELVLQNGKFDALAFSTVGIRALPWEITHDTTISGHLLASNHPHNLTDMVLEYLGYDIEPYEKKLEKATQAARNLARSKFPDWRIAKNGLAEMPSAKEKVWKYDTWLPRTIAQELNYPDDHPWWCVLSEYANVDTAVLIPLYDAHMEEIERRGLFNIYQQRLKVVEANYRMESRGVTISKDRTNKQIAEYTEESETAGKVCVNIAKGLGYDLTLPKSGNNRSLVNFVFGPLGLKPLKTSDKTGVPSLDKAVLEAYEGALPPRSKQRLFVRTLRGKRSRDTAVGYAESYKKFWLPLPGSMASLGEWRVLYPSVNATGTDTLRGSSKDPNEQNISKKENFNLRYMFGPAPGREWWSLDGKNLELRIPAYEAGEEEMIGLFERPNDPPYYGSNHLLMFDTIHPKMFAKHGAAVKDLFASTWYQWCKNGNFAVIYGSVETSGTADAAYHMEGAFRKIKSRFLKIHGPGGLNDQQIAFAKLHGYVETIPDRSVDAEQGYPLLCTRSRWGDILPTVPLNYHVQGTACWWLMQAKIRVNEYLATIDDGKGYYLIMDIHDEIVLDFPKGTDPEPWRTNLKHINRVRKIMEQGGNDIGVPTSVSCEYHDNNWSEGIEVK